MKVVSESELLRRVAAVGGPEPRVVVSGNFATPRRLLTLYDQAVECYRLFMLNAQPPIPSRPGVVLETPFIGPGMRGLDGLLDYVPMRLSLAPQLFELSRPPDGGPR